MFIAAVLCIDLCSLTMAPSKVYCLACEFIEMSGYEIGVMVSEVNSYKVSKSHDEQ